MDLFKVICLRCTSTMVNHHQATIWTSKSKSFIHEGCGYNRPDIICFVLGEFANDKENIPDCKDFIVTHI